MKYIISYVGLLVLGALASIAQPKLPSATPNQQDPDAVHAYITVLKHESSPSARASLLKIALDSTVREDLSIYAASALGNQVRGSTEAADLLKSDNPEVQQIGLSSMMGCSFNRTIWQNVKSVLSSGSALQRGRAATVAGLDKGEVPAKEKAEELIQDMRSLESLPGANRQLLYGNTHIRATEYEIAYEQLARALSQLEGLDLGTLKGVTPNEQGNLKDCIVVARALRSDQSANEDLRRVALECPLPLLRLLAVGAFVDFGTKDDLPTLERVSKEDKMAVREWIPEVTASTKDIVPSTHFPIRAKALLAIERISRRAAIKQ